MREIVLDGFAGGGGASSGIAMALGRSPDVAINHDEIAVAVHTVNHPDTEHYCQNIWKANPAEVARGRKIGLAWFSPDCKHFSKAKGGKPAKRNIRDLAWVVVAYAKLPRRNRPRVIFVENVEEFVTWGPLGPDGRPCPERGGEYFKAWVRELRRLGYKVEWHELVAADYGSPTVRRRLFVIARNDGLPIVWPARTHGKPDLLPVRAGKLAPWRTAGEIIDWSLPCPSIFETSEEIFARYGIRAVRPLAPNTLARIARGVQRYVVDAAEPFIVPITHTGDARVHGLDEPMRTVTTAHRGEHALITPVLCAHYGPGGGGLNRASRVDEPLRTVTCEPRHSLIVPTLIQTGYGERPGQTPRVPGLDKPLGTCVDGQKHALVAAFLAQHNTGMVGHECREPASTIVQKGCTQAVVSAGLVNLKGSDRRWSAPRAPAPTVTAHGNHVGEVRAFLTKFHRDGGQWQDCADPMHTIDCRDRFGVVTVSIAGETYAIVDIGMRMLTPRELKRAQGFSDSYVLDRMPDDSPVTKTHQIRLIGNSVCPQVAAALVAANYAEEPVNAEGIPEFALLAAE